MESDNSFDFKEQPTNADFTSKTTEDDAGSITLNNSDPLDLPPPSQGAEHAADTGGDNNMSYDYEDDFDDANYSDDFASENCDCPDDQTDNVRPPISPTKSLARSAISRPRTVMEHERTSTGRSAHSIKNTASSVDQMEPHDAYQYSDDCYSPSRTPSPHCRTRSNSPHSSGRPNMPPNETQIPGGLTDTSDGSVTHRVHEKASDSKTSSRRSVRRSPYPPSRNSETLSPYPPRLHDDRPPSSPSSRYNDLGSSKYVGAQHDEPQAEHSLSQVAEKRTPSPTCYHRSDSPFSDRRTPNSVAELKLPSPPIKKADKFGSKLSFNVKMRTGSSKSRVSVYSRRRNAADSRSRRSYVSRKPAMDPHEELATRLQNIDELSDEIRIVVDEIEEMKRENKTLKRDNLLLNHQVNKQMNAEDDLPVMIARFGREIKVLEEHLRRAEEKYENMRRQLHTVQSDLRKTQTEQRYLLEKNEREELQERAGIQARIDKIVEQLREKENRIHQLVRHAENLEKTHQSNLNLVRERNQQAEHELTTLQTQIDEDKVKIAVKDADLKSFHIERKSYLHSRIQANSSMSGIIRSIDKVKVASRPSTEPPMLAIEPPKASPRMVKSQHIVNKEAFTELSPPEPRPRKYQEQPFKDANINTITASKENTTPNRSVERLENKKPATGLSYSPKPQPPSDSKSAVEQPLSDTPSRLIRPGTHVVKNPLQIQSRSNSTQPTDQSQSMIPIPTNRKREQSSTGERKPKPPVFTKPTAARSPRSEEPIPHVRESGELKKAELARTNQALSQLNLRAIDENLKIDLGKNDDLEWLDEPFIKSMRTQGRKQTEGSILSLNHSIREHSFSVLESKLSNTNQLTDIEP